MGPHEMVVSSSAETGAEEWSCPSCGRRLLLRWPPRFERVVLHPGDERVVHVGGRAVPAIDRVTEQERRWLAAYGIVWD
ncbi:hypothetical protein [Actinoplanes sp. N902-109]|uniref:hypothetical protein n=1 Tax=Actinoplanes sp. (strain N902-109) TaxID=649831 RepID=UPI000329402E|nr:hypothetical protein [Actinoplanes sp. N902-109]AGL17009.1 hypothetical protein L083_3499 [Actinoplanes sp. N902-109]